MWHRTTQILREYEEGNWYLMVSLFHRFPLRISPVLYCLYGYMSLTSVSFLSLRFVSLFYVSFSASWYVLCGPQRYHGTMLYFRRDSACRHYAMVRWLHVLRILSLRIFSAYCRNIYLQKEDPSYLLSYVAQEFRLTQSSICFRCAGMCEAVFPDRPQRCMWYASSMFTTLHHWSFVCHVPLSFLLLLIHTTNRVLYYSTHRHFH